MTEGNDSRGRPVPSTQSSPPASSGRRWSPRGAREAIQPVEPPHPPSQPRRPRGGGFLGRLSALFTFLLVAMIAGAAVVMVGQTQVTSRGPLVQDKVVVIPRNLGRAEISQLLETEGVITQPFLFEMYTLLSPNALKAGEYQFKQGASLREVREVLTDGRSIQHAITIPEGLTSEQIVQRVNENDILVGIVRTVPREGALLPDTYRFDRGTSREQLLARMEREQRRVLAEVWTRKAADLPLRTPSDLVILASIVEKETGRSDERTRVASVFINRLNRGMRLESDPTIIYGIAGGKGTLGRPILASEIRAPTPYNTYVINGLPPGPIANPGRASMEATANPSRTRDLFFVADGTGGHAFAETYEQHQRNVVRWRQIERGQNPTAAPPAEASPEPARAPALRGQQRSDLGPAQLQWTSTASASPVPVQVAPAGAAQPRPRGSVEPAPVATAGAASPFAVPSLNPELMDHVLGYSASSLPAQDGFAEPGGRGSIETWPVAPSRRNDIARNATQAGLSPAAQSPAQPLAVEPVPAGRADQAGVPRRTRVVDAVEGTALDPLRQRDFDLSTPKTIPALR
jgi:UPF0755 protein